MIDRLRLLALHLALLLTVSSCFAAETGALTIDRLPSESALALDAITTVTGPRIADYRSEWMLASPFDRTKIAERIGEEGADRYALRQGWMAVLRGDDRSSMPQGFDRVYVDGDLTVHVVEAKGGTSALKRGYGHEQGTIAWAEGAAKRMAMSGRSTITQRNVAALVLSAVDDGKMVVDVIRTPHVLGSPGEPFIEQTLKSVPRAPSVVAGDGPAGIQSRLFAEIAGSECAAGPALAYRGSGLITIALGVYFISEQMDPTMQSLKDLANGRAGMHGWMTAGETASLSTALVGAMASDIHTVFGAASPLASKLGIYGMVAYEGFAIADWAAGGISTRQFVVSQSSFAGAIAGLWIGTRVGANIGGRLGGLLSLPEGGEGAAPGVVVGGFLGGLIGTVLGAFSTRTAAENFYQAIDESKRDAVESVVRHRYQVE